MVPLNTNQIIIGKDRSSENAWEKILNNALNKNSSGVKYLPVI